MKNMLTKTTLLASAAAMLAGTVACGPTVPFNQSRAVNSQSNRVGAMSREGEADWTIMIHLAGDNNLYRFALEDVNEMEAGLAQNPNAKVNVIVLFDGSPSGDSKILRIKPDAGPVNQNIISEVVNDNGAVIPASKEIDSGDPVVAAKFVDFATKAFPAKHTMHAFWNHGSGIFRNGTSSPEFNAGTSFFDTVAGGGATGQRVRGNASKVFAADDHGGEMFLRDVNAIMSKGNANLGRPIDIVGFDACLMQHIETAYQYKGHANILVASEELEPGAGWDYAAWLGTVAKTPGATPPQVAKALVDTFVRSYQPGGSAQVSTATLSAVDINSLANNFVPALNEYAAALTASLPGDKAAIQAARQQTQGFYNRDAVDLGDFVRKYTAATRNPRAGAAGAKLQAAMQQMLVAEGHTGSKVAGATGVQVYFPTATMSVQQRYLDPSFLRFAETQGWGGFLKAFTAK